MYETRKTTENLLTSFSGTLFCIASNYKTYQHQTDTVDKLYHQFEVLFILSLQWSNQTTHYGKILISKFRNTFYHVDEGMVTWWEHVVRPLTFSEQRNKKLREEIGRLYISQGLSPSDPLPLLIHQLLNVLQLYNMLFSTVCSNSCA